MWRLQLSRLVTLLILTWLFFWIWQQRTIFQQILQQMRWQKTILLSLLLMLSVFLSALSFTSLVRGVGYRFRLSEGYHSLNLSQIAAMVPGKVWGFAGLAGLLWSKGISKGNSVLIITLHTVLMLSAAALTGSVGFVSLMGWQYTLLALLPIIGLVIGRDWLEKLWQRYSGQSSELPPPSTLIWILILGCSSWILTSGSFALLVYEVVGEWVVSPWLLASTFAAGYVVGYISLITPAGLGVREGVISLILAPTLGQEQALGLALVFRVLHMSILWLNILVTLVIVSFGSPFNKDGEQQLEIKKVADK